MTLQEISAGYKDLFTKTGKVYYFMMYRNLDKLSSNAIKLEQAEKELKELEEKENGNTV